MDKLPEVKEGDRLGATHVNELTRAARIVLTPRRGGYSMGGERYGSVGLPPFVLQSCVITELGFDGVMDENVYTIKTRYFDSGDNTWKDDDEGGEYCLDDRQVATGYEVGSLCQAYYDAQRDAFVPLSSSGGSGPAHILFRILRVRRGVGLNCNAMDCVVLNVSCGGESVASIGDEVIVYDEIGCVFNAPEILLVGRNGYAKQMSNPVYRIQDPLIFEPGTEDIAAPTGRCRWAADRLCCVEEDTTV